ncbi:MAG: hypothetical protein J5I93_24670 [Pirellulaceae bacterium]|nr:hypothetical protein [Pirellulaceae bacterium]
MARFSVLVLICGLLLAAPVRPVHAQFDDLVRRIPDKANTLILINVERAMTSELARTQNWQQKLDREFEAGMTILSPRANRFVMASEMDFEYLKPFWEIALMDLKSEPRLPELAAQLGGTMDNIAGQSVVMLPGDYAAVQFGRSVAALVTPANRQTVGRWINRVNDSSIPPLSSYLQKAVSFADTSSPVIMALDLQHLVSADHVKERLSESQLMKGREQELDEFANKLASIQGVMLGITFDSRRFGKIRVDFAEDMTALALIAKPLLLEVLAHRGAMIDEFEDWTAGVQGNTITLEGFLEESGMRRLMSLLATPPALHPPTTPTAPNGTGTTTNPPPTEESLMALATQQYFQSVTSLLNDLRSKRRSNDFVTWGQVAMWFDRYATKIERMPILNVDPVMLDWGSWVAGQLRDSESAMTGIGAQSAMRQTQLGNSTSNFTSGAVVGATRWGAAGYWGTTNMETRTDLKLKSQARANIRTQERIRGNSSANLIMQGIQNSMLDIRRQMTEKYMIEF